MRTKVSRHLWRQATIKWWRRFIARGTAIVSRAQDGARRKLEDNTFIHLNQVSQYRDYARRIVLHALPGVVFTALVLAVFVATTLALSPLLSLTRIEPQGSGSLAEWEGALATFVALSAAVGGVIWQVRSDLAYRRRVRENDDRTHALRVISWTIAARQLADGTRWVFEPTIRNTGGLPVRHVTARLTSKGAPVRQCLERALPIIFPDGDEIRLAFPLGRALATSADDSTQLEFEFWIGDAQWKANSLGDLVQIRETTRTVCPAWVSLLTTAWYFTTSCEQNLDTALGSVSEAMRSYVQYRFPNLGPQGRLPLRQWFTSPSATSEFAKAPRDLEVWIRVASAFEVASVQKDQLHIEHLLDQFECAIIESIDN